MISRAKECIALRYNIGGGALRSDAMALGDCTPQFGISAARVLGGCIPQFEIFVGKLQSAKFDPCVLLQNMPMILSPDCNFELSAFRTFGNSQTELGRFGPFGSDNCDCFDLVDKN